jgi:hypothetical protein
MGNLRSALCETKIGLRGRIGIAQSSASGCDQSGTISEEFTNSGTPSQRPEQILSDEFECLLNVI